MSTPVAKFGNAERDAEGREYLEDEPWTRMVMIAIDIADIPTIESSCTDNQQ